MRGEAQQVEHKPLCADRSDMDLRSVFLCVLLEVLAGNCEYAFTFTHSHRIGPPAWCLIHLRQKTFPGICRRLFDIIWKSDALGGTRQNWSEPSAAAAAVIVGWLITDEISNLHNRPTFHCVTLCASTWLRSRHMWQLWIIDPDRCRSHESEILADAATHQDSEDLNLGSREWSWQDYWGFQLNPDAFYSLFNENTISEQTLRIDVKADISRNDQVRDGPTVL